MKMNLRTLVALVLSASATAFVGPVSQTAVGNPLTRSQLVVDPTDMITSASNMLASMDAPSLMLADEDPGLWQQYINLFTIALDKVHSTIEGPLASVGVTNSWGISIAIFTASIRTLLLPISIQQSKSSEYMKALKPYVSDIKKKYKNNQDMQNKAIGKLYEDAEQNPLAGCLTSLAQLPVFLGLYRGVRSLAQEGRLNEGFLWIPSLEGPVSPPEYRDLDWLTQWVDGAPRLGWETTLAFVAMPALLVLLQSFTMTVLSPPTDDENMTQEEKDTMENTQRVLKFLPLMIGFFSLQVPAGLTIYWVTTNLYTLTQSLSVRAYFAANPPEFELPEYWDALSDGKDFDSMTPEERRKASSAGLSVGPTFQDLKDEAKFYTLIQRRQLRTEVASSSIAPELQAWVESGPSQASIQNATATASATA